VKKVIGFIVLVILVIGGIVGLKFYDYIFQPNVEIEVDSIDIFVPTHGTIEAIVDTLESKNALSDKKSFLWVADKMKFNRAKPGKYTIKNGWSNKELVGVLRSGRQSSVALTFNNLRHIKDVAGALSKNIELDSVSLYNYLISNEATQKTGLNKQNMITLFIPNTYEVYWDITAEGILNRFISEHKKFWTKERIDKAAALGLTKEEVYTLASIVQKESNLKSEKPTIAGVYLNRLERGILLQADPTVVFGVGDFSIRRVLNRHIIYDSPYNTYMYEGLPPGPIYMPDINTIDAVLDAEDHKYIFFCSSPGYNGKHLFAKTLSQHNANARKYHEWLNKERIYK